MDGPSPGCSGAHCSHGSLRLPVIKEPLLRAKLGGHWVEWLCPPGGTQPLLTLDPWALDMWPLRNPGSSVPVGSQVDVASGLSLHTDELA